MPGASAGSSSRRGTTALGSKLEEEEAAAEDAGTGAKEERKAAVVPLMEEEKAAGADPKRLYVGGLPYGVSDGEVRALFAEHGKVLGIDRLTFPDSGKVSFCRGSERATTDAAPPSSEGLRSST